MMRCPNCEGPLAVLNSRYRGGLVWRRRQCRRCRQRFTTLERVHPRTGQQKPPAARKS